MIRLILITILLTPFFVKAQEPSYFFKDPDPTNKDNDNKKSAELFKNFSLDIDLTPKVENSIGQKPDEKTGIYFAVVKKDEYLDTVASYNKDRKIHNYLLDREFNLYFALMKLEFNAPGNNISKLELYDKVGTKKSYILYRWKANDDNKDQVYLDYVEVYSYSYIRRDFVRVQSRYFTYGGGAFEKNIQKVNFGRANSSKYSNEFYGNSKSMVSYTRYNDSGAIQYSKMLTYNGSQLNQVDTYNEYGVLLSSDKKILENGEANEDFSPAAE